jgi:hypothetical protein
MAQRDDAQLEDTAAELVGPDAVRNGAPLAGCPCDDFRRNQVCDHVLMAAAVRMVRRMIDVQKDQKPH